MKKADVVKKLRILSTRMDRARCMTIDSLWLFGSALYKEDPHDIDLLALYHRSPEQDEAYTEYSRKTSCHWLPSQNKSAVAIKEGMKNIDLHFAKSIEESALITKCLVLVWSRDKPDIADNLSIAGFGRQMVKLLGEEAANIRKQLKEQREENVVLTHICDLVINQWSIVPDEKQADLVINVLYKVPKKLVNEERILAILKNVGLPVEKIEIHRNKNSKVYYEVKGNG